MVFTVEQKAFIIESYFRTAQKVEGNWKYSILECMTEFQERFPNIAVEYKEFRDTLQNTVALFRETGSVSRKKGSGPPKKRNAEKIEEVRQIINEAPQTSIRRVSQQVDLSYETCRQILKKDLHMHPYKLTAVHELLPPDYEKRVEFCQWFLTNLNDNNILDKSFFSDEAWFEMSGYVNSQNMRMWSAENPHFYTQTPLHPQKIGVWLGMSRRRLVGPIFFRGTLTAERYRNEILQEFINQLDDEELHEGYFQQDGATAHTAFDTIQVLQEFFDNRLISRNTVIPYPPRSCDLTVLDFFVWPYLKNSVFKTPVQNLDELTQRISEVCRQLNNSPEIFNNVFEALKRRVQICLQVNGEHFQHLL
jgi:hypothetical protein